MPISPHQIAIYKSLPREGEDWRTAGQIAKRAGVAPRTARQHLARFEEAGIVERLRAFPSHLFRLTSDYQRTDLAKELVRAGLAMQ